MTLLLWKTYVPVLHLQWPSIRGQSSTYKEKRFVIFLVFFPANAPKISKCSSIDRKKYQCFTCAAALGNIYWWKLHMLVLIINSCVSLHLCWTRNEIDVVFDVHKIFLFRHPELIFYFLPCVLWLCFIVWCRMKGHNLKLFSSALLNRGRYCVFCHGWTGILTSFSFLCIEFLGDLQFCGKINSISSSV